MKTFEYENVIYKIKNISKESAIDILRLIKKNVTFKEIYKITKIHYNTISLWCKLNNIKIEKIKTFNYEDKIYKFNVFNKIKENEAIQILKLINEKTYIEEICKILNLSRKAIYSWLNLNNIKIKKLPKEPSFRICSICMVKKTISNFYLKKELYTKYGLRKKCKFCKVCQEKVRKEKQNKYVNIRCKNDPKFKLNKIFTTNFRDVVKGSSKKIFLDYTMKELKEHLESLFESWMTWENWGRYNPKTWDDNDTSTWTWQIDHIIPKSKFNYTSVNDKDFKKCWALSNLRPYSAKLNIKENCKR